MTKIIRDIEEQHIGVTHRRVLLVEGIDDVHAIESFLHQLFPRWESQWVVAPAGKKAHVLGVIKEKTDWIGIVDADEWTQKIISQTQRENANLWILPRYCIENYLVIPQELWAALPPKQQAKVADGLLTLESRITDDLDKWVRHGVLWSVINPLWEGLRSLGFKEALLNPDIAEDDQKVQDKLYDWHNYLKPDVLFQSYQDQLAEVKLLPIEAQLKHWVHGKKFYSDKVNSVLNELLGQMSGNERQKAIFRGCQVPQDFSPLWDKMGLSVTENK